MKKLNCSKIVYIVSSSENKSCGVYYKIKGTIDTAKEMGYDAEVLFRDRNISKLMHYCEIVKTDAKHIFLRNDAPWIMLCLIPLLVIARIQGKNLILDVPTPMVIAVEEKKTKKSVIKKFIHIAAIYLQGPIPFWFFNKIVEYAPEGRYFKFGNERKIILMGNGIDPNRIQSRKENQNKAPDSLVLIGVANLNFYHGYDKIIRAICKFKESNSEFRVMFHIIGEGSCYVDLKKLSKTLKVEENIVFHGKQNQDYIKKYYSISDLAIGTLAFYRIGLDFASPLKHREYALAGMPFMCCAEDPDFSSDLPFVFQVSNDNEVDEIVKVLAQFDNKRKQFTDQQIRAYCIKYCSFESKLKKIGFNAI